MRIVLDTNVIISAVVNPGGPLADLFDRWNDDQYELVTSREQVAELSRVLTYPRVVRLLRSDAGVRVLERITKAAVLVSPLPTISASPDPDDNAILATAIAGKADLLVTGDTRHLLPLGNVQGVSIVTVVEALEQLRTGS